MKYKTRGESTPRNKQKLYFCCHKDDFDFYFEQISDIILDISNCVIMYRDVIEPISQEELEILSEMAVIVVPVTERMLAFPGQAGKELEYAFSAGVPVLPLVVEMISSEAYAEIFGHIQYLDIHEDDHTSLGFTEKLKRYLHSKLVDSETGKRILESLDAVIFLSYRKKDRYYANKIMRKIHNSIHFRDVGIWYDEYLIPGENFDDSIRSQLENSDLVTLLITPNVVNEENYVRDVEYRQAVTVGKKILPTEFTETYTDRSALDDSFTDLPEIVNADNDMQLEDALRAGLSHVSFHEGKENPEHLYLIGLAYLNGVNMEVNRERGQELIRKAAEMDYEPAVDRLLYDAEYYDYNFEESLRLCMQLIRIRKCIQEHSSLGERKGSYQERKSFGEDGESCKERKSFGEDEGFCQNGKSGVIAVLDAMFELVYIYEQHHDLQESLQALDDTIAYAHKKQSDIENQEIEVEILIQLARAYAFRAGIMRDVGYMDQAFDNLTEADKIMEKLAAVGYQETYKRGEPTCAELKAFRAGLSERIGKYDEAAALYEDSVSVFEDVYESTGSIGIAHSLINMQGQLGDALKRCGNVGEAKKWLSKAYENAVKISKEDHSADTIRYHGVCADRMGEVTSVIDFQQALKYHYEAQACFKMLSEHTKKPEYYRDLAINHDCIGQIFKQTGQKTEALKYYYASYEIRKELYERNHLPQSYEDLGISCYGIGVTEENRDMVEKALAIFTELYQRDTGNIRYMQLCMVCMAAMPEKEEVQMKTTKKKVFGNE